MKNTICCSTLFILLASCSSQPTFKPEIDGGGKGGISSQQGVVYSIPPETPVLKMKLISVVIPDKTNIQARMYFLRLSKSRGEYLDPKEISISLPESTEKIYPSKVHANSGAKPLVKLADTKKQTVELLFPIPKKEGHEYPYIILNWKIHYQRNGKNQTIARSERFDYVYKNEPQRGVNQYEGDLEFPYINDFGPFPDEWAMPGWIWW